MSEILVVFKRRHAFWIILDCQHWVKWTGASPPKAGTAMPCPDCSRPTVTEEIVRRTIK